ncbi:MAG: DUF2116 family Zn-ribbon domain-containing protein [Candidatus Pacebacteria bacterium]|nr:DUF2116 family Zn-ribbon domain-containing protein [Candidatus Paceibacterota bacterium]
MPISDLCPNCNKPLNDPKERLFCDDICQKEFVKASQKNRERRPQAAAY